MMRGRGGDKWNSDIIFRCQNTIFILINVTSFCQNSHSYSLFKPTFTAPLLYCPILEIFWIEYKLIWLSNRGGLVQIWPLQHKGGIRRYDQFWQGVGGGQRFQKFGWRYLCMPPFLVIQRERMYGPCGWISPTALLFSTQYSYRAILPYLSPPLQYTVQGNIILSIVMLCRIFAANCDTSLYGFPACKVIPGYTCQTGARLIPSIL